MSFTLPPFSEACAELLTPYTTSASTVHQSSHWQDIFAAFANDNVVTVVNEQQQALGSLTASAVIHYLMNKLYHLKQFYETVLETSDSSVTVINQQGEVLSWTEGAEGIFSLKQQDVIGHPITNFFEYDKLEILQSLQQAKRIRNYFHQPREDLFVLINSNPVYYDGQIIGAVCSETDVTHQVALNEKLFSMSNEVHRLEQEVAKYKQPADAFNVIKGESRAIRHTIQLARKVTTVKSTVLIVGESGVGKEVFAKAIHEASESDNAPFISINCGAIPPSLFESELFGYERGAFSGADVKGRKGKIELARGGTLFLDEIGEMPLEMQVKLLRVLQERKFFRVGGVKEISIDFRILTATNKDLQQLIKEGKFREDLYYRLNVVSIPIPPLRERKEDIVELFHYFIYHFSTAYNRPIHQVAPDVMQEMMHYDWPGNIRELRNIAERLVVFATDGIIRKGYLPFVTDPLMQADTFSEEKTQHDNEPAVLTLQEEMEAYEKRIIQRALQQADGNKVDCAKQLGITRATLYNRMKRLHIT